MANIYFDDSYTSTNGPDRISEIEDDSVFYDLDDLPNVPPIFDNIVITECLHATRNSSVYAGFIEDDEGERFTYDVVFKFGEVDRIGFEAEQYVMMAELQGTVIPRYFGIAFAKRKRGGHYACLMTERFGSSLDCALTSLARSEKAIILSHLQAIHNVGLLHDDFKESNVLQQGATFRLVDFDHMCESHSCAVPDERPNFYDMPDVFTDEARLTICRHIRMHARNMYFWDRGTVIVGGYSLQKEGLPSGRIMEVVFPRIYFRRYQGDELDDILWHYFNHVQTLLDRGECNLEYLKSHIDETAAHVEPLWRAKRNLPPLPPIVRPPRRMLNYFEQSDCSSSQIQVY